MIVGFEPARVTSDLCAASTVIDLLSAPDSTRIPDPTYFCRRGPASFTEFSLIDGQVSK